MGVLRRETLASNHLNLFTKSIKLGKGRIHIRSYTNTLEFFMHDRRGKDVVFVEQVFRHRFGIGAVDVNISYRARLVGIERSVEPNLGHVFESVHPVTG